MSTSYVHISKFLDDLGSKPSYRIEMTVHVTWYYSFMWFDGTWRKKLEGNYPVLVSLRFWLVHKNQIILDVLINHVTSYPSNSTYYAFERNTIYIPHSKRYSFDCWLSFECWLVTHCVASKEKAGVASNWNLIHNSTFSID